MKEIKRTNKKIKDLTKPHLGSFGEYIFYRLMKDQGDKEISPIHKGRTDYEVNGDLYDVKTTRRWLDHSKDRFKPYVQPIVGIRIVFVFFHQDGCSVDDLNSLKGDYDWIAINQLYDDWRYMKGHRIPTLKIHEENQDWIPIKEEIIEFFKEKGMKARVIYRTIQREFGNESPHNLKTNNIKENGITVLILFKDQNIRKDNINLIYAIPDIEMGSLPMLEKTRLHNDKVDLGRIDKKYLFSNINDLFYS